MDKLQMAHEWALVFTQQNKDLAVAANTVSKYAFDYADAMMAEHEKRKAAEAALKRKEIREILNADNTFLEKEGQHFDDVEEWQPDWSEAPFPDISEWYKKENWQYEWAGYNQYGKFTANAPSFDYQGKWQDSLRKRPSNI